MNYYKIGNNQGLIKEIPDASIQLVYFDPPYNTGRDFYNFNDKYSKKEYLEMIENIVMECRRILKKTGTIVIHVEPRISHYFRIICDNVFGETNFRNEIIWKTGGNSKNIKKLARFHDNLIVYSKSKTQKFNPIYFEYDEEYRSRNSIKICEKTQREYVTTAIHNSQPQVNPRPNLNYEWGKITKQWFVSKNKMIELDSENRLEYNKSGIPRIKRYLDEMDGIPLRDLWVDIPNTQRFEKLDYATQKPVKLIERIVSLYSDENDICLDPFAGSGTLGRACENLDRKYILFDINFEGKKVFEESLIKMRNNK